MKLFELQQLPTFGARLDAPLGVQPSIIHKRIFLYGDHRPVLEGDPLDAHICGYRFMVEEGDETPTLYETKNWGDEVQGTLITNLEPKEIRKAKEFYGESYTVDVVPVIVRTIRLETLIFK